jgi:uncharacterized membrane protein SirB2
MNYPLLYQLHVGTVAVSVGLFLWRGLLMLHESPLLQARALRIAPHVVDTVLLLSAIALTTVIQQYPFRDGWLTAKVVGLIVYIALGTVALKRGRTRGIRIAAFIAALAVVAWIVVVARQHAVWPLPG